MSGLLMNRAWLGGAALVLTFSFAACSGDDDDSSGGTLGRAVTQARRTAAAVWQTQSGE